MVFIQNHTYFVVTYGRESLLYSQFQDNPTTIKLLLSSQWTTDIFIRTIVFLAPNFKIVLYCGIWWIKFTYVLDQMFEEPSIIGFLKPVWQKFIERFSYVPTLKPNIYSSEYTNYFRLWNILSKVLMFYKLSNNLNLDSNNQFRSFR